MRCWVLCLEICEWFEILSLRVQVVQAPVDPEFHDVKSLSNLGFVSRHEVSDLFPGLSLTVIMSDLGGSVSSEVTELYPHLFSKV